MFLNTEIKYTMQKSRILAFVILIVVGFTVRTRADRHRNNNDSIIDILIVARSSVRLLFYVRTLLSQRCPFGIPSSRFFPVKEK